MKKRKQILFDKKEKKLCQEIQVMVEKMVHNEGVNQVDEAGIELVLAAIPASKVEGNKFKGVSK